MTDNITWRNEKRSISDLSPAEYNPRQLTEKQAKDLDASLERFNLCDPIIINADNKIIGGHQRINILKQRGAVEVDVRVPSRQLTEHEEKELNLRLNKNLGEWDFDLLAGFDKEMLLDVGFDSAELDKMFQLEPDEKDDDVPEAPETPISKTGDIYLLGRHRVMCGDSTKIDDVEKLMDGKKADMVFTDPPYGMKKESEGVLNDNLNYDDLLEFNKQWIPLSFEMLKDNGSWYCWGIDEPLMDIYSNILKPMAKENKITFRNLITWDKGNGQGQLSSEFKMYPIADEKCLFVQVGIQCLTLNADQYWEEYEPIRKYLYDERIKCGWDIPTMKTIAGHSDKIRDHWTSKSQWNLPTEDVYIKFQTWAKEHNIKAFTKQYEELRKQYEELRKQYEELRAYFDNTHDNMNNVWHFSKTSGEERESAGGHATPKPIALCSRAIKSSSREEEMVLDVFGGSGSTLIACEQLNRTCYMMELDPKYCDVIIKRWEDFTGQKAELLTN